MLFHNLHRKCATEKEFLERQLSMGLDAHAHVGHLAHSLHPDARPRHWIEGSGQDAVFCRRIDTPKGPLTARVRQAHGWPTESDFPLFNDWIVPRAEEHLVKPESDLEKLPYLFGPFRDADIEELRATAREARETADAHGLYMVGGWCSKRRGFWADDGVMGADAMSWLSGFTEIMALSLTHPGIVDEYARIIHEWTMRAIGIYLDVTDAELIIRRGWYETIEFWTPASYRRIIAPRLRREAEMVHQAGRRLGLIVTSAFLPLLDDILDAGVDVLIGLDPAEGKGTDITAVKDRFAARQRAIWGGVSGAMTVELGSEEQTEKAVSDAIRVLGKGGGFILSPVDNVREDTDNAWRNTRRFIETWKRLRATAG
jgi:hypothetical protein